jgi:small subunit ribosomal protein S17
MADEEKNEQTEEEKTDVEETPEAEAPAEEAPKEDAPKEEAPAEDEKPAEDGGDDAPAQEEEAPAEEPAAEGDDAPAAGPSDDDDLDWKAKARLERSRQSGEAKPQQSPEERAAARAQARSAAAKNRSSYRRKAREKAEAGTGTVPAEHEAASAKVRQGRVVSSKADKTIRVQIDTARRHPAYEKIIRNTSTLHVHDERNEAGEGDLVQVVETRPLSRLKRWRLVEILEKAK